MFELLEEDHDEEEMSLVKKAKLEVEKSDAAYMAAVKKADMTRLQLEVGLVSLTSVFDFDFLLLFITITNMGDMGYASII